MKKNTIKWRIFKYNLIIIIMLITLVAAIFNIAVRMYVERDIIGQLDNIAQRTENAALNHGPDFQNFPPPPQVPDVQLENSSDTFRYYFMLDRSLREPLSMLSADYILLDQRKNIVTPFHEDYQRYPQELIDKITSRIDTADDANLETNISFNMAGSEYIAIIKPVSQKNTFGLGWLIIYSSLQKINQFQLVINIILLVILALSALVIATFSSIISKKISSPLTSLNQQVKDIAERKFDNKLKVLADDELQELVNNINIMSEKLEQHDKAQKIFLQNVSHEFRTPLTSIQCYAEGVKYNVVEDNNKSLDIILNETKRMTHLIEELLYLSRLDTIEENFQFESVKFNEFINVCIERMSAIAKSKNVNLHSDISANNCMILIDQDKLPRAITNIISNCIRHANTNVTIGAKITDCDIEIKISDDGPGFDEADLSNLFVRFYKGKTGNVGLGLAIAKSIIEKHNGTITVQNGDKGALFTIIVPCITNGS